MIPEIQIQILNSKVESLEDELDATLMSLHDLRLECFQYESTLRIIACPPRSDGTYNRDRKACEMLAKDVLSKYINCPPWLLLGPD